MLLAPDLGVKKRKDARLMPYVDNWPTAAVYIALFLIAGVVLLVTLGPKQPPK